MRHVRPSHATAYIFSLTMELIGTKPVAMVSYVPAVLFKNLYYLISLIFISKSCLVNFCLVFSQFLRVPGAKTGIACIYEPLGTH